MTFVVGVNNFLALMNNRNVYQFSLQMINNPQCLLLSSICLPMSYISGAGAVHGQWRAPSKVTFSFVIVLLDVIFHNHNQM